jgi:uncharacterized membrane protein
MYDFFNTPSTAPLTNVQVSSPIKPVTTTATQKTTAPKANFWDTLFKAADSTANVINAVKQQPGAPQMQPMYYQQPPQPQPNNTMKNVLIIGGVAMAGLVAWSLLGDKKK